MSRGGGGEMAGDEMFWKLIDGGKMLKVKCWGQNIRGTKVSPGSGGSKGRRALRVSVPPIGKQSELKYPENFLHKFLDIHYHRKNYFILQKKKGFEILCEGQA